jgi:hypothetical protein
MKLEHKIEISTLNFQVGEKGSQIAGRTSRIKILVELEDQLNAEFIFKELLKMY